MAAYLIISLLSLVVTAIFLRRRVSQLNVPLHGYEEKDAVKRKQQYTFGARQLLMTGYDKFRGQIFGVDTFSGFKLIVPPRYLEYISGNGDMSFQSSLDQDMLLEYTYMGGVGPLQLGLFKKHIIANLGKYIPEFRPLIERYVHDMLGDSEEWSPVNLYPVSLRTLGILTSRVMMSTDAPHDETWIEISTQFVLSGIKYMQQLKPWPAMLRPFVYRWMPSYKLVHSQLNKGRSIIVRTIEEKARREADGTMPDPSTVLWASIQSDKDRTPQAIESHLREQLNLAVGGIHTTSNVLTQTLFEMAAHPEYIPELRQEAMQASAKCDGNLDKAALWDMLKLDSFIRETHRLNSPNLTTMQRLVMRDTKLSDGMVLPKGTKLEFATHAIHRSEEFFEKPLEFDGFRFLRLRETDTEHKHHYATAHKGFLGWGVGKAACPGRFLADVEIKLIIAFILLNYDLKNPPGQGRHVHQEFENQVYADPVNPVLMRKISRKGINEDGTVRG